MNCLNSEFRSPETEVASAVYPKLNPMYKLFTLLCASWLFAGTTTAQNLQFSQVKLVSSAVETVPSGKVWKINNIYAPQVIRLQANSGSGGCSGSCNGSTTTWTSFTSNLCPDQTTFNSTAQIKINGASAFYNSNSPIWLPAGSTLQGNSFSCNYSTGWYNGSSGGVSYSCFCPPSNIQTVFTVISITEFDVVP
jgi:hypothetical protein